MAQTVIAALGWIVMLSIRMCYSDHEHMIKSPESIAVPESFETKLQCVMNIEPDKFQWKFYPLPEHKAHDSKTLIDLSNDSFELVNPNKFTSARRKSDLTIKVDSNSVAGDYQCLAYYGASVVASVPWRISIVTLGRFPTQSNSEATVVVGNTINWRCEPPNSNPSPYIDYYKDGSYFAVQSPPIPAFVENSPAISNSLIITNATKHHTGSYSCKAVITVQTLDSPTIFRLNMVDSAPPTQPYFIMKPRQLYIANKESSVFLECSAVGWPIPTRTWIKRTGELPLHRTEIVAGGLAIRNIISTDDGVYICRHSNEVGSLDYHITLVYNEAPRIHCALNATDIKQGQDLDLECRVSGMPDPHLSWFLNGFSVTNDTSIEAIGNRIYFRPAEKRHAGTLQLFARNRVKTVYADISIRVIPISSNMEDVAMPERLPPTHRHMPSGGGNAGNRNKGQKHMKMIPPNKPTVTRLNDEAVMVRWTLSNNKGLPIQFFKVQYRELGQANGDLHNRGKGSRWKTTNMDIQPHITSFEVNNLKPDHVYKFRIAAVYSNNDNKLSPNSDRFHLRKLDFDDRNPLPIPLITHTDTVNSTAVMVHWKYDPVTNITIDGFFVNFNLATSAGEYMKAIVDGPNATSFLLNYLQPDTVYDIKMQTFTSKLASEFSSIMKARTAPTPSTTVAPILRETPKVVLASTTKAGSSTSSSTTTHNGSAPIVVGELYVFIALGVIGGGLVITAIVVLLCCRKWRQKKTRNGRDKSGAEVQHSDNNDYEYVVNSKPSDTIRTNGCPTISVSGQRMTITSNPLADADNKNANIIEMSCLSSSTTTAPLRDSSRSDRNRNVYRNSPKPMKKHQHTDNSAKHKNCNSASIATNTSVEKYV